MKTDMEQFLEKMLQAAGRRLELYESEIRRLVNQVEELQDEISVLKSGATMRRKAAR